MCAWSLARLFSQLHSQPGPHKTVRCPPDLGLMNPEHPAGPSTELYLVSHEYPQCTSSSSWLQVISTLTGSRSLSLVLLPSGQMSTSGPQAEKTALGTQRDIWETEPAHVLLPHSTQHEAAAQSPCLSSTLTPSSHPLSFILPGRISASPLNCLSPSYHHLFPPANSALSSK